MVLISVVYYSEWREQRGKGGARWCSGVAVEKRGYEGDRGAEGDQENGREDRRRRRGRRWLAGGGCLPPLNPLVLALNMIQMLSSLLFRSPVSHPTAAAVAAAAHEPRATILTPRIPQPPPLRLRPSLPYHRHPHPCLTLSLSHSIFLSRAPLLPPPTSSLV